MADKASDRALGLAEQLGDLAHETPDGGRAFRRGLELGARAEGLLHPLLHHRLGHDPHVQLGIEAAADALDHHHGLLQEQQLGPRLHVEHLGILEQLAQQLCHGDLAGGTVHDRLADGAQGLGELRHRMLARHVARLEMHLGDAGVVAVEKAVENLGEEARLLLLKKVKNIR